MASRTPADARPPSARPRARPARTRAAAGIFSLGFALHEGHASDWARSAKPGDTIEATVHGTGFTDPDPAPSHVLALGDPASLPAINSLLDALGPAPATIWFETPDAAAGLPLRLHPTRHELRPVPRQDAGARLLAQVKADAPTLLKDAPDPYVWIACDTATTRSLTSYFREELGLPKQRMHALGCWRPWGVLRESRLPRDALHAPPLSASLEREGPALRRAAGHAIIGT